MEKPETLEEFYKRKFSWLPENLQNDIGHYGLKLQPNVLESKEPMSAAHRITAIFLELLERQFPVEDDHPKIALRSASEFADQLNVHVNHLNRALKETTGKSSSQVIADRLLQESKVLLKHSNWNVGEIAYALGFNEVTHFNNFFKKHLETSPLKFRNG